MAEVLQRLRQRVDGRLHQAGGEHVGAAPVGVLPFRVRLVGHPPPFPELGLVHGHGQNRISAFVKCVVPGLACADQLHRASRL
ncbi:hypothetical protein FQZ97_891440 [compost metagenome]